MRHIRFLILSLAVVTAVPFVNAQVAGRLSGSVVDPTGASVPGASVSVFVQGGKEAILSGVTNSDGLFSFPAVRPDTYDVAVESKGFSKAVVRQVKVSPLQETGLTAIKLEVQSNTVSVEVAADVQAVQLSNAEVTSTITSSQVQNLPVLGRQVSALFQSQPGVIAGSNTTSVNGLRPSFSNVSLDGINIQDNFIRTNSLDYAPMRTTIDQIAEITVSTSNSGVSVGGGASQMTLSTKSGSNTYHGAVYWYNRNSALSANDWFNNKSGVPNSHLSLNQPGVALGGKIIKDKLFFYGNYELFRENRSTSVLRTVLTDAARQGTFTYRDTAGSVQTKQLSSLRQFALDPTTQAMIKALPAGNSTDAGDGLNTTGYRFNARNNEYRDQFVYRGDYYLNSKNSFTGTYNYISNPTDRNDLGAFYTAAPPVSNTIKDHLLSLGWRTNPTPTLTNELRGGFLRADTAFLGTGDYPKALLAGLLFSNPVNNFLNQGRKVYTYSVQDNATWLKGKHEISFGYQLQLLHVSPWNDSGIVPTITLGISSVNTNGFTTADFPGIRSTDVTIANNLFANLAGIASSASQTFNVNSTTSGFVPGATNLRQLQNSTHAAYVSDKWKARNNLTLNLGLRYEYWTPMDEKNGLYIEPRYTGSDVKSALLDPNSILDFIGGPSGRKFYNANKANFAPNVGFAWDPTGKGKTSLRGGYSIAYVNDNMATTMRSIVGYGQGLTQAASVTNLTSLLTSNPTVPTPAYKVPRTLADNYAVSATGSIGLPDPNLKTPFVQQWSLGIQHELKEGTIVNLRYVGNHSNNLLRQIDLNQVNFNAQGFFADFQRAQSNLKLSGGTSGAYNSAIAGSQPLTVFPLLANGGSLTNSTNITYLNQGQVATMADSYMTGRTNGSVNFYPNQNIQSAYELVNGGYGNYNGLQFEATKRTRSGLQIQFSYTFSKALSNTTGDQQAGVEPLLDNNNPSLEYARSPFDNTHAFKANYYYELPFGPGKKWHGNRITNTVIGGWAISGIWLYQSGSPYSILSGYGTFNRGARSTSTNTASVNGTTKDDLDPLTSGVFMTGNGPYFVSPSLIGADGRGAAAPGTQPFAGQVFYNPNAGTVGNLQRRMFNSPWQWKWDASVKKEFRFGERQTLNLHFDFFNWANHPTFYIYPSTSGDYGSVTNQTINSVNFGKITDMNYSSRILQFGAYYRF